MAFSQQQILCTSLFILILTEVRFNVPTPLLRNGNFLHMRKISNTNGCGWEKRNSNIETRILYCLSFEIVSGLVCCISDFLSASPHHIPYIAITNPSLHGIVVHCVAGVFGHKAGSVFLFVSSVYAPHFCFC